MNADYPLLDLASLVIFAFGTLAFSILAVSYFAERLRGRGVSAPKPAGGAVFPAFALACASAFLLNMLSQIPVLTRLDAKWEAPLIAARGLATGLLPPFLPLMVFDVEARGLRRLAAWRGAIAVVFAAAVLVGAGRGLAAAGIIILPIGWLLRAPAVVLCAAAALGMALLALSHRAAWGGARTHRRWMAALLAAMAASAVTVLAQPGAFIGLLPDYLLLAFFCVNLYYRERLAFFDVFVKRGLFFAAGLAILSLWFGVAGRATLGSGWNAVLLALVTLPIWLAAPWIARGIERAADRLWLRRRYSGVGAERKFLQDVQACATEAGLRERAASSLAEIFQAPAAVEFGAPPAGLEAESGAMAVALPGGASRTGHIMVAPRPDGIPFLSDDRRSLQSIASALGVVLEKVRLREQCLRQQEREQELRWLASRAELKALRAQINPHFLFNALNSIAGLIAEQPQAADHAIERLGRVFRYTLRKSEREWVPLGEEVEFIAAYLQVEQARFGERLQLSIEVDPAAARISIPAMSIQPLIENAVKHGVSAVEGRGMVALRARVDEARLVVEVRDNGPGFPAGFSLDGRGRAGGAHGLRNVLERLRGYYGSEARLEWSGGCGATRVWLTIPRLETAEARCAS